MGHDLFHFSEALKEFLGKERGMVKEQVHSRKKGFPVVMGCLYIYGSCIAIQLHEQCLFISLQLSPSSPSESPFVNPPRPPWGLPC